MIMNNKLKRLWPRCRWSQFMCIHSKNLENESSVLMLCKYLDITQSRAEHLCLKYPTIKNISEARMNNLFETLYDLGFPKGVLLEEPTIFSMLPITFRYRYTVLQECGVADIKASHIVSYLTLMRQNSLQQLKLKRIIPFALNVEMKLANYLSHWPTSLTNTIYGNTDEYTLYLLRLKMIQRYLELNLDLPQEKFLRGLYSYPTVKHRPFQVINETLSLLQTVIQIPREKIISNLYLLHADSDNLKNIIFKFRSIGGIDIKEILRMHPKLAMQSYLNMVKIRDVLYSHGILDEAQRKCFEIYTLSPETVDDRIIKSKLIPELEPFIQHPRFLKMIYYNKKVMTRLKRLSETNKKCSSLNVLSGCSTDFEVFEKSPGDRLGKGKDLVFCVKQCLGKTYSKINVHQKLKRHPYWINIPIVQVQYVYKKLSKQFSADDIYNNCQILLYPWSKIRHILDSLNRDSYLNISDSINLKELNKSQKLSLLLYELEKHHYFSGNGVWSVERSRNDYIVIKDV